MESSLKANTSTIQPLSMGGYSLMMNHMDPNHPVSSEGWLLGHFVLCSGIFLLHAVFSLPLIIFLHLLVLLMYIYDTVEVFYLPYFTELILMKLNFFLLFHPAVSDTTKHLLDENMKVFNQITSNFTTFKVNISELNMTNGNPLARSRLFKDLTSTLALSWLQYQHLCLICLCLCMNEVPSFLQIQDNIDLLCRSRKNITDILKEYAYIIPAFVLSITTSCYLCLMLSGGLNSTVRIIYLIQSG